MKKTMWKKVLRQVRGTFNRFIAIFAITMLGAGFYAGLKTTGVDMKNTANQYYQAQHLMDYRLVSTMGFTNEDIETLREQAGVQQVMPSQRMDVLVGAAGEEEAVAVHALPDDVAESNKDYLNQVVLMEGRMPQVAGECLLDDMQKENIPLGSHILLSAGNAQETKDLFAVQQFTVVGYVQSPVYISYQRGNTTIGSGSLAYYVYTPMATFDSEYYTEVLLTLTDAVGISAFSNEYDNVVEKWEIKLKDFADSREQIRYDEITSEAQAKLDDAQTELDNARTEVEEKLGDAKQQLDDARVELADAKQQIKDNEQKLADAQKAVDAGEAQLATGKQTLQNSQSQYDAGLAAYNEQKAAYDAAMAQVNAGYTALTTMQTGLAEMSSVPATLQNMDLRIVQLEAGESTGAILPEEQVELDGLRETRPGVETGLASNLLNMASGVRRTANQMVAAGREDAANSLYAVATSVENAVATAQGLAPGDEAKYTGYTEAVTALQGVAAEGGAIQLYLDGAKGQLEAGKPQLDAAAEQLADAKVQLDAGYAKVASAESELADARQQIQDGTAQLQAAKTQVQEAEKLLQDGQTEYDTQKADADKKIADAQSEIDDGKAELDKLEAPEWYLFTRGDNPGYSGFWDDSDRIAAIAKVFPVFFILVAALVCLTTMTRMVEDQRAEIGTLKALGFGKSTIAMQFVLYAGVASLLGSFAGVFIGSYIFPTVIFNAYRIMYKLPDVVLQIHPGYAAFSVLAFFLCTTAATLAACGNDLRSTPANLMRPKAPKEGKSVLLERVPFIWKRMSFTKKVTARNLFRYKKRFFMTVIGVAGCTALLVTGFGIKDSISGIVDRQYEAVSYYDMIAVLSEKSDATEDTELNEMLPQLGVGLYMSNESVTLKAGEESSGSTSVMLSVPENPQKMASEFMDFHTRQKEEPIMFPDGDKVVLTEKIANKLNVKAGDTITVVRSDNSAAQVQVAGICENYLANYVYMTPETYQKVYDEAPSYMQLLLRLPEEQTVTGKAVQEALVDADGVRSVMSMAEQKETVDDMLGSLNAVVWLVIASAAALAIVVLYNLTNINITERIREIATLKVLGFYNGEVYQYVYRENMIITAIGMLIGLVGGIFLHRYIMTTVEVDDVMFRRVVQPLSFVLSAAFTMLCAVVVDIIMMRKLKKIDMVESLKSAE